MIPAAILGVGRVLATRVIANAFSNKEGGKGGDSGSGGADPVSPRAESDAAPQASEMTAETSNSSSNDEPISPRQQSLFDDPSPASGRSGPPRFGRSGGGGDGECPCSEQFDEANRLLAAINTGMGLANQKLGVIAGGGGGPRQQQGDDKSKRTWLDTIVTRSQQAARYVPQFMQNRPGAAVSEALSKSAIPAAAALGKVTQAGMTLVDSFNQRTRELSAYSPILAQTTAMNTIKELMADFREGKELGPGLADISSTATDIWIEIRNAILPIKKVMLDVVAVMLKGIAEGIHYGIATVQGLYAIMEGGFKALIEAGQMNFTEAVKKFEEGVNKAIKAFEKNDDNLDWEKELEHMDRDIFNFGRIDAGRGPEAVGGQQGLRVPALGGL